MSRKQKIWIFSAVGVVVVIAAALVFTSVRGQKSSAASAYQTTTVQKGTLTSTVEGPGSVASSPYAALAWEAGGQVELVDVKIGDKVKEGAVLATLVLDDKTRNSLENALISAQQNLAQLTSAEAVANAKLAVTSAQTDVINAQYGVNYAKYVIAKENLDNAQQAYDDQHIGKYINNAVEAQAYERLYSAQQTFNTAEFNYSLYGQAPTQRQVNESQAKLDLANATLASAQNYLKALTDGTVPDGSTDINLLKFKQAQLAVQIAQDNLDVARITAPFDGTITQEDAIEGAFVSNGTPAFRIDNLSNLVVDVQVTEVDINGIQDGQPATLTLDAVPNKTFNGSVIKTNMSGTSSSNSVNFTVTIQITDADASIKPGMAANVTIITNQVADVLLVPSTSIFTSTDGQQFVYLIQNGTPTPVNVTTGASSDSATQITSSGLNEGDTIVLSFASSSIFDNMGGFGFGGMSGGDRQPPTTSP
jgi:HlyD family secretion protein